MVTLLINILNKYVQIEKMKTKNILVIIALCFCEISFGSCSNEGDDNLEFSASFLKQTQWVGTFNESYIGSMGSHISATANTGLFFESKDHGRYSIKWESLTQVTESSFEYAIDDKLFIISNGNYLNGSWLITQFDSDKLVLEKGTNGEGAYKSILTLERKR